MLAAASSGQDRAKSVARAVQVVDYFRCCQCHLYSPLDVSSSRRQLDAQLPRVPMVSWPQHLHLCLSPAVSPLRMAITTNKLTSLEAALDQWRMRASGSSPSFLLWWGDPETCSTELLRRSLTRWFPTCSEHWPVWTPPFPLSPCFLGSSHK